MSASEVCAHERAAIEVGRQEQPRVASVMIIAGPPRKCAARDAASLSYKQAEGAQSAAYTYGQSCWIRLRNS